MRRGLSSVHLSLPVCLPAGASLPGTRAGVRLWLEREKRVKSAWGHPVSPQDSTGMSRRLAMAHHCRGPHPQHPPTLGLLWLQLAAPPIWPACQLAPRALTELGFVSAATGFRPGSRPAGAAC